MKFHLAWSLYIISRKEQKNMMGLLLGPGVFVYLFRRLSAAQKILKFTVVVQTISEHSSILTQPPESCIIDMIHQVGMMDFDKIRVSQEGIIFTFQKNVVYDFVLVVIEDGPQQSYYLIHKTYIFAKLIHFRIKLCSQLRICHVVIGLVRSLSREGLWCLNRCQRIHFGGSKHDCMT